MPEYQRLRSVLYLSYLIHFFYNLIFTKIYFFCEYNEQAKNAEDNKIEELVGFINNERENGKLYISYPMVEALKHVVDYDKFKE